MEETRRAVYCQQCGLPQHVAFGANPTICECGGGYFRHMHPSRLSATWKQPPYSPSDARFLRQLNIASGSDLIFPTRRTRPR